MLNPVVDDTTWAAARDALLDEEKAATTMLDRIAAKRRHMPWREVTRDYRFVTPDGPAGLAHLFDNRRQLIVYHHMMRGGDRDPCSGCGLLADQVPHLAHLHARDTTFTMVSSAPLAEILAFRARMGWTFPWVESTDSFTPDHNMGDSGPGFTVFIRDQDRVFHTYTTTDRGTETALTVWGLLDMTPMGRQENWQDAPDWVPQGAPYQWWRLHDRYAQD